MLTGTLPDMSAMTSLALYSVRMNNLSGPLPQVRI